MAGIRIESFARTLVSVGATAGLLAALTGCVPYQTYQDTKTKLDQARDANRDLSKKYNEAVMQLLRGQQGGQPVATTDDPELRAQLLSLQKENDELRKAGALRPEFTPDDFRRVGVENEGGGMQLSEALLFGEGSAALKPTAHKTLDEVIAIIQDKYPQEKVIIEGHTDNQPLVKTKERWRYNMRLGYERAQAVFEYFVAHGIPEERIAIQDFSLNKPTDPSTKDTAEGRTRNRRVVIRRAGAVF